MFELGQLIEIKRKKPRLNPQSSYFRITNDLIEEIGPAKHLFDYSYSIKKDRIYIYLPDVASTLKISQDSCSKYDIYQLTSRHLTLDKFFSIDEKRKHGLYPAHYTEEYLCKIDDEKSYTIKVHIYLDVNNNFSYIQAKKFTVEEEKLLYHSEIKDFEDTKIFENAKIAKELFGKIIEKRTNFLNGLIEQSNQLEKKLDLLSYRYMLGKKEEDFLLFEKTSHEFIKVIDKLNCYEDKNLDLRGKIAQTILDKFKEQKEHRDISYNGSDINVSIIESDDEIEVTNTFKQISDDKEKLSLMNKLRRFHGILNKKSSAGIDDIDLIILKLNALSKAKIIILQLDFMQDDQKHYEFNAQDQELISTMNKICFDETASNQYIMISKLKTLMLEKFKEFCCSGEVEKVTSLYPYIKDQINIDLLQEIAEDIFAFRNYDLPTKYQDRILKGKDIQYEENIIKVINFLYENVAYYRINFLYIMGSASNRSYDFSFEGSDYEIYLSHLFSCVIHNKTLLFEQLIGYGALPNGIGLQAIPLDASITITVDNTYALSLIKSCLLFDYLVNPFFIKKLFEYGVEIRNQEFFMGIAKHELLTSKKLSTPISQGLRLISVNTIPELNYCAHYKSIGIMNLENILDIDRYTEFLEQLFSNEKYSNIDLMMYFISLTSKYFSEQLIIHDNNSVFQDGVFQEKVIIITDNTNLDSSQILINIEHIHYLRNAYTILPNVSPENKFALHEIINKIKVRISEIAAQSSIKLNELINSIINQIDFIKTDRHFSLKQTINIINLKMIFLKAALLLITFKNGICKKDLCLIESINIKRIEELNKLLELFSNVDDRNNTAAMINAINKIMKAISEHLIPIEDRVETIPLATQIHDDQLEQHKEKEHTCSPPPGSIKIDGITVVPKCKKRKSR